MGRGFIINHNSTTPYSPRPFVAFEPNSPFKEVGGLMASEQPKRPNALL
jgi:hypothetical protein